MKTLKVLPNPWSAIDAQARPCGAVMLDLDEHTSSPGKYIGAVMVATELTPRKWRKIGRYSETTQEARYERTWKFTNAPVSIPAPKGAPTGYYRDRLARGELIAADQECAIAARIPWRDPAIVLEESKSARRAEYDAQHGNGAFDALQPVAESKPVESKPETKPTVAKRTETPKE